MQTKKHTEGNQNKTREQHVAQLWCTPRGGICDTTILPVDLCVGWNTPKGNYSMVHIALER